MKKSHYDTSRFDAAFVRIFSTPDFDDREKRAEFLEEMPGTGAGWERAKAKTREAFDGQTLVVLRPAYEEPLLNRGQELHQFRKYNLLKYLSQAKLLANKFNAAEDLLDEAIEVRNFLTNANLRLGISIASKYSKTSMFEDYIADSYSMVMKAVDYFDWRKGFKFSTYATWVVRQNLWRIVKTNHRYGNLSCELSLKIDIEDERPTVGEHKISAEDSDDRFEALIRCLPERDRYVMRKRFRDGLTLVDTAKSLSIYENSKPVSRERIRQIEQRCLSKLEDNLRHSKTMDRIAERLRESVSA